MPSRTDTSIVCADGQVVSSQSVTVLTSYAKLSPNQVEDLFLGVLGTAGYLALRAKIPTVPVVAMFADRLARARDIRRDQVAAGIALMVAELAGEETPLSQVQADTILGAWPAG
jgi:hypothetical protein